MKGKFVNAIVLILLIVMASPIVAANAQKKGGKGVIKEAEPMTPAEAEDQRARQQENNATREPTPVVAGERERNRIFTEVIPRLEEELAVEMRKFTDLFLQLGDKNSRDTTTQRRNLEIINELELLISSSQLLDKAIRIDSLAASINQIIPGHNSHSSTNMVQRQIDIVNERKEMANRVLGR